MALAPDHQYEAAWSPSGLFITLGCEGTDWLVRVFNFASFKHREYRYTTEAEARLAYAAWLL